MGNPCFIDTNILMYAVGSEHPLKKPCLKVIEKMSLGEMIAVTDTEVFQEVAYRYWSQKKWDVAVEILRDYSLIFNEIYPIESRHLEPYYDLLSDYPALSPRDAIHVAVMRSHNLKYIYTTDRDFAKVPGLKLLRPEDFS